MAYSYVRYTGNGSTSNFSFSFPYLEEDHIFVKVNNVSTSFTFLNSSTVSLSPAPASGMIVEIRRVTPRDTPIVDFVDGSVLLESDLDLLARFDLYLAQETFDLAEDSLTIDATNRWDAENKKIYNLATATEATDAVNKGQLDYEYPAVATVAASIANVNVVGTDLGTPAGLIQDLGLVTDAVNTTVPDSTSKINTVALNIDDVNTVADNITAVQNATSNAASAAGSATAAATSATSASNSATAAASSATSAATSATNAATSATNAATSSTDSAASASLANDWATKTSSPVAGGEYSAKYHASAASSSATASASSATSAATSATNASSSASAASTSATNAAASAASAAALLDNFDDRYLGAKASAPTVDNDGNALIVGALYFDTTTGKMRTYTTLGWVDASSVAQAALTVYKFVATASQTTFSGASANGTTLAYIAGGVVVALNGVVLVGGGDDYTATNGSSVVLASGADSGDTLEVYAFSSFSIASVNGSAIVDGTITPEKLSPTFDLGVLS